jgi:UDP-glucose 4-epimerase
MKYLSPGQPRSPKSRRRSSVNVTRRILVTGGAGFIGSHLVDLLIGRGEQVIVYDNLKTGRRDYVHPRAEFVHGDVTDESALLAVFERGVDAVCHIAGQASIRLSYLDPAADLNVNTLGTINVLKGCFAHRVPRLLFASSMTIYGNPRLVPTPETAPPDPVSYYGITKYAAERYVHLASARSDIDFRLNVTSFRMFNVYGVRQSLNNAYQGVFAIFIGNVLRGEPINIHADGEQSRDFVHVSDVVRAWADALDHPASTGEVINLGSGRATSVNRLCDLVLENFGHTRATYAVRHHPAQPGDIRLSAADVTKARQLLGWQPTVPFEDGMRETIAWARGQIHPK